jgi:hypothetical protein
MGFEIVSEITHLETFAIGISIPALAQWGLYG